MSNLFSVRADSASLVPIKTLGPAEVVLVGKTFHVKKHYGGRLAAMQTAFLKGMGYTWAIEGDCISACTMVAEAIGCVSDGARMGYHASYNPLDKTWHQRPDLYRPELVEYINSKGGFPETPNYDELTWLEGEELDRFFPRCAS